MLNDIAFSERVRKSALPTDTLEELQHQVEVTWNEVPQEDIRSGSPFLHLQRMKSDHQTNMPYL